MTEPAPDLKPIRSLWQRELCVEHTGHRNEDGYGTVWYKGKHWKAHRLAWTLEVGSIPDGLFVLHLCDNPACINVKHLVLGTHGDNMADRNAKGRQDRPSVRVTHCPKGHEYTSENTYAWIGSHGYESRRCRECHRIERREAYHRGRGGL